MMRVIDGSSWTEAPQGEPEKDYDASPEEKVKHLEDLGSISSLTESGLRIPQCRICFQGPEKGELLSPCHCDGSVRFSHQSCLVRWIGETGSWTCELCRFKYHVCAISTKNPLQWQSISLKLIEKVQISAIVLGLLFLIASIGWLTWSMVSPYAELQRKDYIFQILYGMYVFMDFICIGFIIQEGPSFYRIMKRWHTMNQTWKVLNYEKTKDLMGSGSRSAGGEESGQVTNAQELRPCLRPCLILYFGNTVLRILTRLRPNNIANSEMVMRVATV
ncbi:E3 ubiquitin-protein ligase MARCHF9-like [Stigmatopora nigra]